MSNEDELTPLRQLIAARSPWLVGIDGMYGAGKTSRVAKPLGRPVISLDDFLVGNGKYIEGLRYDALRAALDAHSTPLTVEGCCLLAVLERTGYKPDLHVYVRRVTTSGSWEDRDIGMGEDRDHALGLHREIRRVSRSRSKLEPDLINYHADYRPFQNAALVIDLVESE